MSSPAHARAPLSLYFTPRMLLMLPLGFSSGLPLALTASTLAAWLKDAGIDIRTIGLFAAVSVPYSLKFLWAPAVDAFPLPLLSHRRGWMLAMQLALIALIAAIASLNPAADTALLALLAAGIAFFSASQDVVIDAYRVERLKPEELGPGTAVFTLGYQLGMLVAGAGSLLLADRYGWHTAYLAMAGCMLVGVLCALFGREPEPAADATPLAHTGLLERVVVAPLMDLALRRGWWLILLFIATYKLGDAFLGHMANPFFLAIHITKTQIALIGKTFGLVATILGTFAGGWICTRYGTLKPLLIGGLLHALTNLMFLWQAHAGPDMHVLAFSISLQNFTGGLSSAVLVVFISELTHRQFTATQYALLSSLSAVGRTTLSSLGGFVVAGIGWQGFFVFSVLLAAPSLLMLPALGKYARKEEKAPVQPEQSEQA
jgi:PAT family beta-lactamase induction signal transducer AmpG